MLRKQRQKPISTGAALALLGLGAAGAYAGWRVWKQADNRKRNAKIPPGRKIVILGAGFAGMGVAQELAALLPAPSDAHIALLDARDHLLFTPMLTEVAGGMVRADDIISPLHTLPSRVEVVRGRIEKIAPDTQQVTVRIGDMGDATPPVTRVFEADQLVVALGAVTNYHDIPGLQEHSFGMKSLEEATALRNRVLTLLERAGEEPDKAQRRAMLTFVVGGGGYTGVETMAAINDLARDSASKYPRVQYDDIRTILVEPTERLLQEISPSLAAYAQKKLAERSVEIILKTGVKGAGADYVDLDNGERIPAHTLVWTAGVTPNPLVKDLNVPLGKHGGIVVGADCAVPGRPGLWAAGDCAEIPQPDGKPYGPTAQNATRQGPLVARNIVATLRGETTRPFEYTPIGELALVGNRVGVAEVYGRRFSGLLAWAMWRVVYLAKMPGLGQRARILLDWAMDAMAGGLVSMPATVPLRALEESPKETGPESPPPIPVAAGASEAAAGRK